MTYTKNILSGSTSGASISVAATSSPGTTIHTAVAGSSDIDEVWIYAVNLDNESRTLYLQWGGVAAKDLIPVNLDPNEGIRCIIPGYPVNGGLEIKAYGDEADKIAIHGFVNEITT
jgi:hypothetical protein